MDLCLFSFPLRGDSRGSLVAVESEKTIPFSIQRAYYIFGTKEEVVRGLHAHKKLEQVLICLHGKCTITMNDGNNKEKVILNDPTKGLYVGPLMWHEMHDFSSDCVLLVLASDHYNEEDYIRNYDSFIEIVIKKGDK